MGTDPAEFLGHNPFTASIEVKLNADYANSDSVAWIKDEIQSKNKQVIEINYPQDLLDAVNSNIRKISIVLLGLATLLTLISFALINNTIRLAVYSKRFLIHTMKLVGSQLVVYPAAVFAAQHVDRDTGCYDGGCGTDRTGVYAGAL